MLCILILITIYIVEMALAFVCHTVHSCGSCRMSSIVTNNLVKRFEGVRALDGLSLEIAGGGGDGYCRTERVRKDNFGKCVEWHVGVGCGCVTGWR